MSQDTAQHIPRVIYKIVQEQQLGLFQRAYGPGDAPVVYRLAGPLGLLFGLLLLAAFLLFYSTVFSWWPQWQAALIPLVSLCWLLIGSWLVVTTFFLRGTRIYLFSKGLIYQTRRKQVVKWNQVVKLRQERKEHRTTGKHHQQPVYTLVRNDGASFVLAGDLPGIEALYRFLEDLIMQRELPHCIADYRAGHNVDFGALLISKEGISIKHEQKQLSWENFDRLSEDETLIHIHQKRSQDTWADINQAELYNVKVLQRLVEYIKKEYDQQEKRRRTGDVQPVFTGPSPHISAWLLDYKAGRTISFGALHISKQGLILQDGKPVQIAWNEVAGIGVGEQEVMIRRRTAGLPGEWYTIPAWQISDHAGLKELIACIVRGSSTADSD
ncbi:MAG: hypothetical protein IMW89_19915 [Ktedonobacteraceae bacterium]|nr:hypothetical protein [Ktedonobacteraceae bacterium]